MSIIELTWVIFLVSKIKNGAADGFEYQIQNLDGKISSVKTAIRAFTTVTTH